MPEQKIVKDTLKKSQNKKPKRFLDYLRVLQEKINGNCENLHYYVCNLSSEIEKQYKLRLENRESFDELTDLLNIIVPYFLYNSNENNAINFLIKVNKLEKIQEYITSKNFTKLYVQLLAVCRKLTDQDELIRILNILYELALKFSRYSIAIRLAINLDDHVKVKRVFDECPNDRIKQGLTFTAARQKKFINNLDKSTSDSNRKLSQFYSDIAATKIQAHESKIPTDAQENHKGSTDSKVVTLSNIYFNAFVTKDANMTYDTKAHYLKSNQVHIQAGANLGIGICCASMNSIGNIFFDVLCKGVKNRDSIVKQCSFLGLGMAYSGRAKTELLGLFVQAILNKDSSLEESVFASLSLGLSQIGRCNKYVAASIIQALEKRNETQLTSSLAKFYGLSLAFIYLGQQDKCQSVFKTIDEISHPIKKFIQILVISLAYIGRGNKLQIQKMICECLSHKNSEVGILGLSLIASHEQIENESTTRILNYILDKNTEKNKNVPIALTLLSISNPQIPTMDDLFKLAKDADTEIAYKAIICLGLVNLGTSNSKLAQNLKELEIYYKINQNLQFCIKISQCLNQLGKGILSIQPYYVEGFILSKVGLAGILVFLTSLLDSKPTFLIKHHYFIYFLSLVMQQKPFFELNDKIESILLNKAVNVINQTSQTETDVSKQVNSFKAIITPLIIPNKQRIKLQNQQYIPIQQQCASSIYYIEEETVEEKSPKVDMKKKKQDQLYLSKTDKVKEEKM